MHEVAVDLFGKNVELILNLFEFVSVEFRINQSIRKKGRRQTNINGDENSRPC